MQGAVTSAAMALALGHCWLEMVNKTLENNRYLHCSLEKILWYGTLVMMEKCNHNHCILGAKSNFYEYRNINHDSVPKMAPVDYFYTTVMCLTHCGLVTSYDDIDLCKNWLRWWRQAINLTNVNLSSKVLNGNSTRSAHELNPCKGQWVNFVLSNINSSELVGSDLEDNIKGIFLIENISPVIKIHLVYNCIRFLLMKSPDLLR